MEQNMYCIEFNAENGQSLFHIGNETDIDIISNIYKITGILYVEVN